MAAVEAAPTADPEETARQWCDVYATQAEARAFAYPPLTSEGGRPSGRKGTPRWINVWATWCKPCVEELPRISEFQQRLRDEGSKVEVELLAADETEAVDAFAAEHRSATNTKIMQEPTKVENWLMGLGLGSGALPVHLFVDGGGRLRCSRLGGVGANDYEAVQAVLRTL